MSAALLQALGGLAVVIALLFASAWLFRRSGGLQALGRGPVKVVGGISVGTREKVLLIEVADSWVLIGVAPGQVRSLHTLPRQALPGGPAEAGSGTPFQQLLGRLLPGGPAGRPS